MERGRSPQEELVEKAVQHLDRAIQLNPQYLKAHNLYAEILLIFGHYEKAREHLETVLRYEKEGNLARSARRMLEKIPKAESK
jgi:tetratricopeptide (TPR) repeat protein